MAAVVTRCHPFPDITPSLFLPLVRVRFSVVVSFHPDNTRAHKVEGRKSGERNSLFLFLILSLFFYFRFWLASKKEGLGSGFHHEKCVAPLRSKEQNKTKQKEKNINRLEMMMKIRQELAASAWVFTIQMTTRWFASLPRILIGSNRWNAHAARSQMFFWLLNK